MTLVAHLIRAIVGVAGAGVRTFLLAIVLIDFVYAVLLAGLCFWIASRDAFWKGVVAAIIGGLAVAACGVVVAIQLAVARMIRQAIEEASIGKLTFDALFEIGLGVSDDTPEGRSAATTKLHGRPSARSRRS